MFFPPDRRRRLSSTAFTEFKTSADTSSALEAEAWTYEAESTEVDVAAGLSGDGTSAAKAEAGRVYETEDWRSYCSSATEAVILMVPGLSVHEDHRGLQHMGATNAEEGETWPDLTIAQIYEKASEVPYELACLSFACLPLSNSFDDAHRFLSFLDN